MIARGARRSKGASPVCRPETASGGLRRAGRLRVSRNASQTLIASGKNRFRYDRARQRALLPQNDQVSEVVVHGMKIASIPPEDEKAIGIDEGAAIDGLEAQIEEGAKLLGRSVSGFKNTLHHIFANSGHDLAPLLSKVGSETAAYAAIQNAVSQQLGTGSGQFVTTVIVDGVAVTATGAFLNGSPRVSTAYVE